MEKFDLENFPTSESARKMLGYVSNGFYDESYVGKWIFQVMGMEYDKALEIVSDLPAQFFPETATWGLMYHEIKWGLPVRPNLSYEERRRLIYQKQNYRMPMTPYNMEVYLKNVTGYDIHVYDIHDSGDLGYYAKHPNVFQIGMLENETTDGIDYGTIENLVMHLKQSHTTFVMEHRQEFRYNLYSNIFAIRFITIFYPRLNLDRLKLDRTWKLDGSRKLSGYNSQMAVDLYPVRLRIRAGVEGTPQENPQICLQAYVKEEIKGQAGAVIRLSAKHRESLKEQLKVAAAASVEAWTGDVHVYNKNRLDGKWKLNGGRKLNGGTELR